MLGWRGLVSFLEKEKKKKVIFKVFVDCFSRFDKCTDGEVKPRFRGGFGMVAFSGGSGYF